jgi:hypothetical protein
MAGFTFGSLQSSLPPSVALPWYEREDWPILHQMFLERDAVSESYDVWKARAVEAEARYVAQGYDVVRVIVRPESLLEWCSRHRRRIDLRARHDFAQTHLGLD